MPGFDRLAPCAEMVPYRMHGRVVQETALDCTATVSLNENVPAGVHEPLSALQGGEGGTRRGAAGGWRWAPRHTGSSAPLTLPSPPGPAGGEVKGSIVGPIFGGRTASTAEINFDDARVVLNEVD